MSDERVPDYADVPTFKELGYAHGKGLWSALYAPAGTPRDVLETLHKAAVQALELRAGHDRFQEADDQGRPQLLDSKMRRHSIAAETAYWKKVTDEVKVELPDN